MPTSIIPLLAERLDIPEDQVRPLLSNMVQELRQRAASDSVQLSGLGTFREDGGALTFDPSPALQRRVNRPYEGLSAESLSPAPGTEPDASPAQGPSEEKAPASDADQDEVSGQDRPPTQPDAARSPDSFTVISVVLTVFFLAGAGWFVIDQTNLLGPTQNPPSPTAAETPSDGDGPSSTADSAPDSQPDGPAPPENEASDARDWTIVVASSSSRDGAQEAADQYTSQFDSVAVVSGTVDNTTWYRVTIGRYASESTAERVLSERADALPSDAWTHRLE